jgi:hypothetical protein
VEKAIGVGALTAMTDEEAPAQGAIRAHPDAGQCGHVCDDASCHAAA